MYVCKYVRFRYVYMYVCMYDYVRMYSPSFGSNNGFPFSTLCWGPMARLSRHSFSHMCSFADHPVNLDASGVHACRGASF